MTYRISDPYRDRMDMLTDEEWEVQQALEVYEFQPENERAFVPTRVLYAAYRRSIAQRQFRDPMTTVLSQQQFGVALGRVFSFKETGLVANEEGGRHPNRVRRTWHGQRMWGYLGLVGPETIESRDSVGRPRVSDVEDLD